MRALKSTEMIGKVSEMPWRQVRGALTPHYLALIGYYRPETNLTKLTSLNYSLN